MQGVKKVIFPDTLKVIEAEAFRFTGLEELNLPEGLVELGDSAFFQMQQLKTCRDPGECGCDRTLGIPWLQPSGNRRNPSRSGYVGPWIVNKSCTIRCYKGSKMDAYCDEYELKREYIGAESVVNE